MKNQDQALDQREMSRQKGVEQAGEADDCNDEQGPLPCGWLIPVVVEDQQSLNVGAGKVRCGCNGGLPTKDR